MKRLGKVTICGVEHEIRESNEQEDPNLSGAHGYWSPTGHITVDNSLSSDGFRHILFHEIMHGIFDKSGALDLIASAIGTSRTADRVTDLEEILIRILTPHILIALKGIKVK